MYVYALQKENPELCTRKRTLTRHAMPWLKSRKHKTPIPKTSQLNARNMLYLHRKNANDHAY